MKKTYCNCLAMERGLNPVGYAGTFNDAIVVEVPLPWRLDMTQKAGALPQKIIDLLALWLQRYYAGEGYTHLTLAVAPDPEYTKEGYRRVMYYSHPVGLFTQFHKVEYWVPDEEVGSLVWSLFEDREALPRFEPYRIPDCDSIRDILICTHGTVDAACAKFGYPLYKYMRDTCANDQLRVWRVSHFGGHVFAPTLMDMPMGHYWAYIGSEQADQICLRNGDAAGLRDYYRGWAGMSDGFLQTAECELWQQHGWSWFNYPRNGEVIAQDENTENPQWADVRICYRVPGGGETTVEMRVEASHSIETETSTQRDHRYAYPQYRLVEPENHY